MARRKDLPGVDVLFGDLEETADDLLAGSTSILLDRIEPDHDQPRKFGDPLTPEQLKSLEELAASIKIEGVLQPVIVRSVGRDSYILVAGERRWRAAEMAGLDSIPAIVRDLDPNRARVVSLIENIQREDLNEDERADALVKLKDLENLTWKEVGERVGLSEPRVKALARITKEPEVIRDFLRNGLSPGHIEVTRSVDNPEIREEILKKAKEQNIPVRKTREMVKLWEENPDLPMDEIAENALNKKKKVTVTRIVQKPGIRKEYKRTFDVSDTEDINETGGKDGDGSFQVKDSPGYVPAEDIQRAFEEAESAANIPHHRLKAALKILEMLELEDYEGEKEDIVEMLDRIEERVKILREGIGGV